MHSIQIRHVAQPYGSKLCGQACVACLLGISIEDAISVIGHTHGTKTKEILSAIGITGRLTVTGKRAVLALLKLSFSDSRNWHWVVKDGTVIMDPSLTYLVDLCDWEELQSIHGGRVTSGVDLSPWYRVYMQ